MINTSENSKHIFRLGLSRVFKAGLTLVSVAALTFGFLTFIDDKNSFLVLAYILRMLEGVAGAIQTRLPMA